MTKLNWALSCGVALGALLTAAGGALATDFIVPASPPDFGPQVLPDPGDTLLIETGGTIVTVAIPGVSMNNIDQSATNNGLITTSGADAYGIFSVGADAQIDNSGDITTLGSFAHGIFSVGPDAQIGNSGDITTSGFAAYGIWSQGVNAQIDNSGVITTSGFGAYGIFSEGPDARIGNSGDITTTGVSGAGIVSAEANARIDNSGDITTSGADAHGIWSVGANARIGNSGGITTSGISAYGIYSTGITALNAQITNSGGITTSGEKGYGIYSEGDFAQIANSGDVTTSGLEAHGIYSVGDDARITNSGDITTTSNFAIGIASDGARAQITNSGSIVTSGGGNSGIDSIGDDVQITNSGEITTTGNQSWGITSLKINAKISNIGAISTTGYSSKGIGSIGDNAQITNSGDITTSGNQADGIDSEGAYAQITNSGSITTTGDDGYGIYSIGHSATVTNSGTIISEQSFAAFFRAPEATLNLLAGSAIQGGIGFDQPGSATLNIGPGLNTALTFTGTPGTINSYGAPMVIQGPLVAVVDPTGFSAQDEMLTDLTRAISGAVDGRLNAARFGYVPVSGPVTAYVEPDAPVGAQATDFGYGTGAGARAASGFWAAGLGAYRDQDADGIEVGFDSSLGGLLIGFDGDVSGGTRIGAFLGASVSNFETDANSQEIDADSYFGGLYASFTGASHFLDLAVTGGLSEQSSDRTIANNLVIGGLEHATADYDGLFISPSATIGTSFAMNGGSLIPSLRARYAGLFLDGYDETGSAANLSVEDRDVNIFDVRAQLAYALAARPVNDGTLHAAFRFGADAAFADNDNVEAALLGTALNFDVSGDDTVRGFGAVDLSYLAISGSSFFLGAEAGYDSGDAFTLDVRGGFAVPL